MKMFNKFFVIAMLAVTLIIQNEYYVDGSCYCDFEINCECYEGVYYEDMLDMIDAASHAEFD
jgi:hypothetical protein